MLIRTPDRKKTTPPGSQDNSRALNALNQPSGKAVHRSNIFSILTSLLVVSMQLASAATVVVNSAADTAIGTSANCAAENSGTCTIRDAIAIATSGSDTIIFNTDMTIELANTLEITFRNVTIDATGKSVTIDANNAVTALTVGSSVNVRIKHLTIQHGAESVGGGVTNYGILDLSNCTLLDNTAIHFGGAIYNDNLGTLTVSNSTISGNRSGGGGAGIYNSGRLKLTSSTLSGNSSRGFGGGITNGGTLTLTDSTLWGNIAGLGGGVSNNGALELVNSTLSGNHADNGGGLFNMGALTITSVTLSGNIAASNGGGISSLNPPLMINSIVATNIQANGGDIDSGIDTNSVGNLIGGDPKLGPLQDNGGPTQTLLPEPDSPAIDAVPCTNVPPTDQRGLSRPQGIRCDVGSVELVAAPSTLPAPVMDRLTLLVLGLMTALIGCARICPPRAIFGSVS